jgi:hypothetical protein
MPWLLCPDSVQIPGIEFLRRTASAKPRVHRYAAFFVVPVPIIKSTTSEESIQAPENEGINSTAADTG